MSTYHSPNEQLIYRNLLACPEDLSGFVEEGRVTVSFPNGCLRLENAQSEALGQKANYVLWCGQQFPADFLLQIDFRPVREPGLAMLFFAASGRGGRDLFDPSLAKRTGEYPQYHHGDINAFHLSFFRRKEKEERSFHTCNLRKSYGFYLAAQGADPIPDTADAGDLWYTLSLLKKGAEVHFAVNDLEVLSFRDDGISMGPLLAGGYIGLRQLAPMAGEYRDLRIWRPGD